MLASPWEISLDPSQLLCFTANGKSIIVGFVVGVIAKMIMPGKENMGLIATALLGITGSVVATYAGKAVGWYDAGQGAGWIGSVAGAFLVLWVYQKVKSRGAGA